MANQNREYNLLANHIEILELEKDYFNRINEIISSEDFKNDLLKIEEEIQRNYTNLASTWNVKNKIKVAAERLVRHHIYKNMIGDIRGIYESPISSDLGIVFDDCVLCIDCKTLDTVSNSTDIRYTTVEPNQTSFDNSSHLYIKTKSNLACRSRVERYPVLTYIVKIIYRDDGVRFVISRTNNAGGKPSLVLTCIPNGELSDLFGKDLIFNFKTYKYYNANDGEQFTPVSIPTDVADKEEWVKEYCEQKGFHPVQIPQARGTKDVFYDAQHQCYWTYTSDSNTKKIMAINYGDSMRLNNDYLRERYDSNGTQWNGYIEFDI